MKPLNVLLAPGIFPPESGGPATFASRIGIGLSQRGHNVHLVTNGTAPPKFDQKFPFSVTRIPRYNHVVIRYIRQITTLLKEINEFEPDVVLVNAFDVPAVISSKALRVPVATKIVGDSAWERAQLHGIDGGIEEFQNTKHSLKIQMMKMLRTYPALLSDEVIIPSNYLDNLVRSWGVPSEKTNVIHNSISVERQRQPLDKREERIITVGRMVPWKGFKGIIRSFIPLTERNSDIDLHIVGDGPQKPILEQYVKEQGIENRVRFHGNVLHNQVIDLISKSRIFALNSTYEGLPHVILEAMMCGTPVVASNVGGTPEIIDDGKNGILVQEGNIREFLVNMESLLENQELWRTISISSREKVVQNFDLQSMIDKYEITLINMVRQ